MYPINATVKEWQIEPAGVLASFDFVGEVDVGHFMLDLID